MFIALFASVVLGIIFGSFTSMASYRLPRGESLVTGRSHCPHCQHVLGIGDLFPVLSWLWNRGKCRYCHTSISAGYLLHEITLGLLFLLIFLVYGYSPFTLIVWAAAVCLVILIAVDLEHTYLPDSVQFFLAIVAIGYGFFAYPTMLEPVTGGIIYAAIGFGLRLLGFAIKKTEAFGWGDVKFFGVAGIFLGLDPAKAALFFLCSGISGMVTSFIWQKCGKGRLFPFGPALAVGLMAALLLTQYSVFAFN